MERVNRYAGNCVWCRKTVARMGGIVRKEDGKWNLYCNTCTNKDEQVADPGLSAYIEAQEQAAYNNRFLR